MPNNPFHEICNSGDLLCLEFELKIRRNRVIRALAKPETSPTFEQLGALAGVDESLRKAAALIEVAAEHARRLVELAEEEDTSAS
jgi:hypothetical protein